MKTIKENESKQVAGHTPRPWKNFDGFIIGSNGHTVCDPRCLPADDGDNLAEMDANSDLIIRAVNCHEDLLEACKAAIKWAEDVPSPYRDWGFIKLARTAIAKATGSK